MAAITTAVVGTAIAVKSMRDQKKAQKQAAQQQQQAAAESAEVIGEAGVEAEKELLETGRAGARQLARGAVRAEREIAPFTEASRGFGAARDLIMSGRRIGGPIGEQIRLGGMRNIQQPTFAGLTNAPVRREIERQVGITEAALTPDVVNALLTQGAQGIGAIGDVASIRQRGFEGLADIVSGTAGQRASALVGAVPQLQQLSAAGQEARLLGDVAGQRARTGTIEALARLGGRVA